MLDKKGAEGIGHAGQQAFAVSQVLEKYVLLTSMLYNFVGPLSSRERRLDNRVVPIGEDSTGLLFGAPAKRTGTEAGEATISAAATSSAAMSNAAMPSGAVTGGVPSGQAGGVS